jgi:hypothetical protein
LGVPLDFGTLECGGLTPLSFFAWAQQGRGVFGVRRLDAAFFLWGTKQRKQRKKAASSRRTPKYAYQDPQAHPGIRRRAFICQLT